MNDVSHIIGKPAACIGNFTAFGEYCYLTASVFTQKLGSSLGAGGHSAEYQYFHGLVSFSQYILFIIPLAIRERKWYFIRNDNFLACYIGKRPERRVKSQNDYNQSPPTGGIRPDMQNVPGLASFMVVRSLMGA
jgi:hypothetical protein